MFEPAAGTLGEPEFDGLLGVLGPLDVPLFDALGELVPGVVFGPLALEPLALDPVVLAPVLLEPRLFDPGPLLLELPLVALPAFDPVDPPALAGAFGPLAEGVFGPVAATVLPVVTGPLLLDCVLTLGAPDLPELPPDLPCAAAELMPTAAMAAAATNSRN